MADLSNLKISNTFVRLLQVDPDTSELQDGGGSNPSSLVFDRTTLKYVDGNEALNYVLTSDAAGNASWAAAGGTSDVYWSANTDGSISPSGLTTTIGVGTTTPNKPLTVVGDISGTTDLYLGTSTYTGSTITAEEALTIKGRGVDNDYLHLSQDRLQFYLDGLEFATFTSLTHPSAAGGITFNSSSQDYDFTIKGDDTTPIFQVYGESGGNRIRIRDHLTIGNNDAISHADMVYWGLAVTGSSLFYGGVGVATPHAIHASGVISASTEILAGDGDGFISAATIDAPILSGISTYGDTIYSGSTNLADVLISLSADSDYWSASTSGNITVSGLSTTVQTEGDLRVSGTVYTTNIQTTGSTSADTLTIEAGEISLRNRDGVTEYLKVGPQGFTFLLNDTEAVTFLDDGNKYYFDGRPGSGTDWYTFNFAGDNGYMVLEMNPEWEIARFKEHMAIGATYGTWSNAMAIQYGLYVTGSSQFQSGGTYVSTNAIEAVGDISGTTNLYLDGNLVVTGNTVMNGTLSATTSLKVGNGDGFISATTINAPSISATTLYGTIDGGSF